MKTQREWIMEIVKLMNENPEMPIHFAINQEYMCDEFSWMFEHIFKVEIDLFLQCEERIFIGKDQIVYHADITEKDPDKLLSEAVKSIIVYTQP